MIRAGLLSFSLLLLTACGDSEPVATSYKKSMAAGTAAPATGTGTTPAGGTADALKAQGTTLYASKCAGCHQPLATSAKKGKTAAQITAAATNPGHASITATYPTATEATALEAALK